MDSSWTEKLSADRKKAARELIQGREQANQLRVILGKPFGDDGLVTAKDLVMRILGSFTDAILMLNRHATDEASDQIPANTRRVNSTCWDGRTSEDSDESSKTSALKDRRGCYKRRKTYQTRTTITPTLIDDGHAWRKYGQKAILNAKHPRNYYRCTHKFDQGCQATKQMQRTEDDDPPMYRITYHGNHTCEKTILLKAPQIILNSTPGAGGSSSVLLNFGSASASTNPTNKSHEPYFPTFPFIKQESYKVENPIESSSSGYLLSPDLTTFESSGPMAPVMSSGSDHGDVISSGVYSCATSTHSHNLDLGMTMMVGDVDFDDVFGFEFC